MTKSRLVLALYPIGWKDGARFYINDKGDESKTRAILD